jgi:hypothetical protein
MMKRLNGMTEPELAEYYYQHRDELLVEGSGVRIAPAEKIRNLTILHDALDLVVDLWPKPGYQTVTIETHQWIRLRRVLLEIPRLVAADE